MTEGGVANPAPLGLFGFALTTALLQGPTTGITDHATIKWVYGFAMFYGGLAQLLAGMWEFKRRNSFAAAAFSSYGGFWMGFALTSILEASKLLDPPAAHDGKKMMLALWGVVTFLFFVASLSINIALQLLFLLLSCVFFLLAGGVANPHSEKAAGWIGLVVAGIAFYAGGADLINERFQKTLLPLGVKNWVPLLVPGFQRAVGKIPLIGPAYLRGVENEDRLAGYGTKPLGAPIATKADVSEGKLAEHASLELVATQV